MQKVDLRDKKLPLVIRTLRKLTVISKQNKTKATN